MPRIPDWLPQSHPSPQFVSFRLAFPSRFGFFHRSIARAVDTAFEETARAACCRPSASVLRLAASHCWKSTLGLSMSETASPNMRMSKAEVDHSNNRHISKKKKTGEQGKRTSKVQGAPDLPPGKVAFYLWAPGNSGQTVPRGQQQAGVEASAPCSLGGKERPQGSNGYPKLIGPQKWMALSFEATNKCLPFLGGCFTIEFIAM